MIEFNINDYVSVTLTAKGARIWNESSHGKHHRVIEGQILKQQLHVIMTVFGPHGFMCGVPFKTVITLHNDDRPIVRHAETLIYYDQPQVFVAEGDDKFVCSLMEKHSKYDTYMCARATDAEIAAYSNGELDIMQFYRAAGELYYLHTNDITGDMELRLLDVVPDDWL